jgi:hypothetical protein
MDKEISQELFLELAKSPLISDINNSILFRLQSLNISNFEVGARENADYYIEEHSLLTGVIVGVGGDLQRADSIEIVMDQQSSSNLSEDQSKIHTSTPYSDIFLTHVLQTDHSKTNKKN